MQRRKIWATPVKYVSAAQNLRKLQHMPGNRPGNALGRIGLHRLDNIHTIDDLAENTVAAVKMWGSSGGDEKL